MKSATFIRGKSVLAILLLAAVTGCLPGPTAEYPRTPAPTNQLPMHVYAPAGKLSLYADYSDVRDNQVTLYIINRTKNPVALPAQDGDVYAKLETQTKDGQWRRAQTHHYSFCGHSYYNISIGPDQFLCVGGWRPESGETQPVRYSLYDSVTLSSNVGRGPVDLADLEKVEFDRMSVSTGDVAHLKRVLFEEHGLDEDDRDAAISRLGAFPAGQSLPVLERLLESPLLEDEQLLEETIESLAQVSPRRLKEYAKQVLTSGPASRRTYVIEALSRYTRDEGDELRGILINQLCDPETPDARRIMSCLARRRTEEVNAILESMTKDPKFPQPLRIAARYEREQWYGDEKVEVEFETVDRFDIFTNQRLRPPVPLTVKITNSTEEVLSFEYRAPSEILSLYLEDDGKFRPPKAGVEWFQQGSPGELIFVRLEPGQTHQLRINVLDYFDRSSVGSQGDGAILWLSCSLPGIHKTPQLCGGGTYISIRD